MKYIGISIIIISIVLMSISIFKKSNSFFNIRQIITDYFSIFKGSKRQYIIFYGYPLLLSVGIAILYNANEIFYNNLCIILSIILSMLFSILAIITSFNYSKEDSNEYGSRIIAVVNETCNSIIYTSLICIILLIYSVVMLVFVDMEINIDWLMKILGGIAYYLFTVLLLNLLLIIKRIGKIIAAKIKKENGEE